jgi:hypothetical protein
MVDSGICASEARYTVTEKECLAILFELQKFRQHLYGERFGVVTDHSALVWLMSPRVPKHRKGSLDSGIPVLWLGSGACPTQWKNHAHSRCVVSGHDG